jgi:NADH-ubiquinone oxidoreductase chain 5
MSSNLVRKKKFMILSILLLPLVSSLCVGLFGRFLGRFGSIRLTTVNIWIAISRAICSTARLIGSKKIAFYNLSEWLDFMTTESPTMEAMRWSTWSWFSVDWNFTVDGLSCVMLVVVTIIAALVHTFSIFYMGEDPHAPRFFAYLSLFATMMRILVTANNLMLRFVGWEGVGIMSFCLINFWYTRALANKAAIKAIVVNRIGDVFLLVGLSLIFAFTRTLDFNILFPILDAIIVDENFVTDFEWVGLFLLLAAIGTSSQIILHTWLPDAM